MSDPRPSNPRRPRRRRPVPALGPAVLTASAAFLAPLPAGPAPVRLAHGNDLELWVGGDFNGDALPDVAVIDRAGGLLRAGYGRPGGGFAFGEPVASGAFGVTWALAAPFTPGRDALLVFSPSSNRVQQLDLAVAGHVAPSPVNPAGPGPRTGAALDLAGADNTPDPDLLVANEFTTVPGAAGVLRGLRNKEGTFYQLGNATTGHVLDQALAVAPDAGEPELAGWLRLEPGAAAFELRAVTIDSYTLLATVAGLPATARYTCATFEANQPDFFFYAPGSPDVRVHRIEGTPGNWSFDAGTTLRFPAPLQCLAAVGADPATRRLLAVYLDGSAALAGYSRGGGLEPPQPVAPAAGTSATGALPLPSGEVLLLAGPAPGAPSAWFFHHAVAGDQLELLGSGDLPPLATAATGANVLVFDAAPFRTAAPNLLGCYHLLDWTTSARVDPPPGAVRAEALRFVDSAAGLANPDRADVAATPPGAAAALVNQFHPSISVFHQGAPVGSLAVDVAPVPAGGSFRQAVQLAFSANPPAAAVYWRIAGSASPFNSFSAPVEILTDTTVEFYAAHAGAHSPLHTASFSFALPPEQLDADGDGVPDFVETHLGLDPAAGRDSDDDSICDLTEILGQTDPADPADPGPDAGPRPDLGDLQPLDVTFLPHNGLTNLPAPPYPGTEIRAFDAAAGPLGMQGTGTDPARPAFARIDCRPVDPSLRVIVAASPLHSSIVTTSTDKRRGREIVGIVPVAEAPPVELAFTYDPAQPATQAEAWIDAARSAWTAAARPPIVLDLGIDRTLHLVLVERSLQAILVARGDSPAGIPVSLTPFREPEAGRETITLSPAGLARLESPPAGPGAPPDAPCVLPRRLVDDLANRIAEPDYGMSALRDLTREIYRISSLHHNASPGQLQLPLDALRDTLATGALPAAYAAHSGLLTGVVDAACAAAATLTGNPPALRPRASFLLTLAPPAAGCTLATDEAATTTYALLAADGTRFELPEDWAFLPGTRIRVNAFTDGPDCLGHPSLTVIDAAFDAIVLPAGSDADADLLDDQWELFHFGHLGFGATDTLAGGPYSIGEEFFSATDPHDPSDDPPGPPVTLAFGPPCIALESGPTVRLTTTWPAAYADRIEVVVFRSADLQSFTDTGIHASHLGGGLFEASFPEPPGPRAFYQLRARLR